MPDTNELCKRIEEKIMSLTKLGGNLQKENKGRILGLILKSEPERALANLTELQKANEPRCEKNGLFAYAKTKTQISFAVTAKLISTFVFATGIVQSLYFLNPNFQVSSHFLWLYSPVCVGPGPKPQRLVFSERGSNNGTLNF